MNFILKLLVTIFITYYISITISDVIEFWQELPIKEEFGGAPLYIKKIL